ncbi:hypothetical protein BDV96DRAFT_606211 [Lophiotrema nucula]|uniref:BTB domain-containing protein n=1 Tax=Lophiotrema nucula TaxID=690887 RepID=A0A6A5YLR3_9PLEO|nr:hypothetical protein BDV96DRAFT_606211 [Lophiotrema nucula]
MEFDMSKNRKKLYRDPEYTLQRSFPDPLSYDVREDIIPILLLFLLTSNTYFLLLSKRPSINDIDADFIIVVEDQTMNVHKKLLVQQSTFFEKLFKFPGKEVQEGRLILPEKSCEVMDMVLQFLYKRDYTVPREEQPSILDDYWPHWSDWGDGYCINGDERHRYTGFNEDDYWTKWGNGLGEEGYIRIHGFHSYYEQYGYLDQTCQHQPEDLTTHALVYAAADYYGISALKALCAKRFEAAVHVTCLELYTSEIVETTRVVCRMTPPSDQSLRKILVEVLAKKNWLFQNEEMQRVIEDHGDMAFAVLRCREKKRVRGEYVTVWEADC